MKKSIEEKLRNAVENNRLNYEKYFGDGCKWYVYYLEINVHYGTFLVDFISSPKSRYGLVPRLQVYYLNEDEKFIRNS